MKIFVGHPDERALSLFAGDDLGFLQRLLVERHIAKCGTCMASVASYERLRAQLASEARMPEVDFEALSRQIRAAARTDFRHARGQWRWKAPAGAALAITALIAALFVSEQDDETTLPGMAVVEPGGGAWDVPLLLEGVEAQITPEGRLSVQAFHPGSGTLTITDYYAP